MHTLSENTVIARLLMSQLDRAGGLTFCCSVRIWFCHWTELWSRCGLMVSALVSGSSGPGSSPGRGHCAVFLGTHFTFRVPLSTQVYKWVPEN